MGVQPDYYSQLQIFDTYFLHFSLGHYPIDALYQIETQDSHADSVAPDNPNKKPVMEELRKIFETYERGSFP